MCAGRWTWAVLPLLLLLLVMKGARAQERAPQPHARVTLLPKLTLPAWSSVDLEGQRAGKALHPLKLSLDLSMSYLRLAVHGDGRPGLAPFLGTSTESLGGFRLRF